MLHNLPFYTVFLLYLLLAGRLLMRPDRAHADGFKAYLLLLLPAFLLVPVGITVGIRQMPRHKVVIHGYRTPLTNDAFTLGSDTGIDDIRFHYRFKDEEKISPGILRFTRRDDGAVLTQTDPASPNIITIDQRPLRSLPLAPEVTHRITFGAYNYSSDPDKTLLLTIHNNKPVFQFGGQTFTQGFSRELFFGQYAFPYDNGKARHLAYGDRLRLPGLKESARTLLKQAALIRINGGYFLAGNDADIRLNGQSFPTSAVVGSNSRLSLFTRQLGEGRTEVRFKVHFPKRNRAEAFLTLLDDSRKEIQLPLQQDMDRICLTAGESYYSGAIDINNTQFPKGGAVINRVGEGFVFRGEFLEKDKLYSSDKAVFSIDESAEGLLKNVAWFALLFLAAALFAPPKLLRREPLIGVVLSAAFLLLAFRLVLAFRAWQGPPFKTSTLIDSLQAPYLFAMLTLALTVRYRFMDMIRYPLVQVHNFFRRANRIILPRKPADLSGLYILALALYGFLLFALFPGLLGSMFPALIVMCLVVSMLVNLLEAVENRISFYANSHQGRTRWKPAVWMAPVFFGLILLAPALGGKEVISILPGRPRPDIFIQVFLLMMVAYFAAVWERESRHRVPNPLLILVTFGIAVVIPFMQGAVSRDMGFFVMTGLPLTLVLICVTWRLDPRVRLLLVLGMVTMILSPLLLKFATVSLDETSLRRIAFFVDEDRVKAEYFFDYLAHLPILWASNQGLFGGGFFHGDWYPAIGETSVNDNVASVFIQGELGGLGSILIIALFAVTALAPIRYCAKRRLMGSGFQVWFILGIALMLIWTAATMFLANLGYFPLTGKNLPLLGVDSMNDVIRYGILFGFLTRYMTVLKED